jgi:hypothetical protein
MATEEIDGLSVDLDQLPAELGALTSEIRRWAVRDGEARAHRVEAASTDDLAAFWLRISQELPAINGYLDAHVDGTASNEAVLVGATAEAALAAAAEVERRTGQRPAA